MKNNGFALAYVINKTHENCLAAVRQEGIALIFVDKQTPDICLQAVENNGFIFKYIQNPTNEMRRLASASTSTTCDKEYPVDEQGHLSNSDDWDPCFVEQCAIEDGLELSLDHWVVIFLMRDYYEEYQLCIAIRVLAKKVKTRLGDNKGTHSFLWSLFPNGPTTQGGKYAGLPSFRGCGLI